MERAQLLLGQRRFDLAEQELRQELAGNPQSPRAHALLGIALGAREQFKEATAHAQKAIGLDPTYDFAHYALASILQDRHLLDEAREAMDEAVRLDPEDADYHAGLAGICLAQRSWSAAVDAADLALAIDAEHVGAANVRATALTKLGRRDEAAETIEGALNKDPDNAFTHANQGWRLLHAGKHREAMKHFQEALRIDPELDWARQGIVEAMQARNFVYRQLLRYFLWMSQLSARAQWGVVIGAWLLMRVTRSLSRSNPELAVVLDPILYLYLIFVLLTWTGPSIANLLLRLHPLGKHALSREQVVASNWVGSCVLLAAITFAAGFFYAPALKFAAGALMGLILPLASGFNCDRGWPRIVMFSIAAVLAALTLGGIAIVLLERNQGPAYTLFAAAFIGAALSTWIGNWMGSVTVKR